ncbi:MAG: hypothetical protein LBF43_01655 [Puniceicoccales bacterium]|jgi:prefoldin subunit 5|nr:hypothetical protein [Puniceicoccales bacterium]
MSFNSLSSITYTYPVPLNATTHEPIVAGTTNLQAICSGYKNLFQSQYTTIANNLLRALQEIVGGSSALSISMTDGCDVTIPSTWPNTGLGTTVSQEGNKAYVHYLKDIVNDLRAFCRHIETAGNVLQQLDNLTGTAEQAHVWLDTLQSTDQLCWEVAKKYSGHFKLDMESDTWVEVFDAVSFSSPYAVSSQLTKSFTTLDDLRNVTVDCIQSTGPQKKGINTFNELSKLDKLKFIRLYYNLILNNNKLQTVFPNDLKTGYPCLPNIASTKGTEDAKELGALELFYIGYLIDRDGPINALSSFLELKTQALRQNISLMMAHIEALNQCLTFINRALDLLNSSQRNGEKTRRIPDAAYVALTLLCGGTLRGLKKLTITGAQGSAKEERYLVLQCNAEVTDDGYELTKTGKYLLVKANEEGLEALLGTTVSGDGNAANSNGQNYAIDSFTFTDRSLSLGTSVSGIPEAGAATIYKGYSCTAGGQTVDCRNMSNNAILLASFSSYNGTAVKQWLPTAVEVDKVLASSVLGRDNGKWTNKDEVTNTMITSWTTAFTNKTQYINTAIESINNEIGIMRTKIDTFDSAASTFRNNASDTYKNILGRIG